MMNLQQVVRAFFFGVLIAVVSPVVLAASLVNLKVSETGMQRISYEELVAGNANLSGLKHKWFGLTRIDEVTGENILIPIKTKGQLKHYGSRKKFGHGGYIEFYAEYLPNLYSASTAYTLHYDKKLREKIKNVSAADLDLTQSFATEYVHSSIVEENLFYDLTAPSKTDAHHYGYIFGQGPNYLFNLKNVVSSAAKIEVELFGLSDLVEEIDHSVSVKVNGDEIGTAQFSGNAVEQLAALDADVVEGDNTLRVDVVADLGVPFDVVGLNKFKVKYQRTPIAEANLLHGELASGQFSASGFNNKSLTAYRLDLNGKIERLTKTRRRKVGSDNWKLQFNAGVAGEYFVVADGGYKLPTVEPVYDNANISTGEAEYLIITSSEFIGADLDTLVGMRSAKYSVKVVDVTQIYGQFGIHQPTAKAIKDYIEFAAENLNTKYVLIIGGDNYDYKNFSGVGAISYVPTTYVRTSGGMLPINQAPSDAIYGDLDNDGVPDIPVGRFPLRQVSELANVVNKIALYEARQGYQAKVVVVADKFDNGSGLNFTNDALATIELMPSEWKNSVTSEYKAFPDNDGDVAARTKLLNAINAGVEVTTYIGHSSQKQWSTNPAIIHSNDVANLINNNLPTLVTQWGCWNTYFVHPSSNSMAEELLMGKASNGDALGAVTVLGASTLTTSSGELKLGKELSSRMYNPGITIGDAVVEAKQAMALESSDAADILLGWQILGDPALVIQPE